MDWRCRSVAALLALLLVATGVAVTPAAANSCDDSKARSVQYADGRWSILVSSGEDHPAEVYEYTADWERVDLHPIGYETNRSDPNVSQAWDQQFTSHAKAPGGGWWVLAERGTVYRFDGDWNYTGESRDLAGLGRSAYDVARANGSWWVVSRDSVVEYADGWSDPRSRNVTAGSGLGPLGLVGSPERLRIVDGGGGLLSGGTVHRFSITPGGSEPLRHDRARTLDWETGRPYDAARADGRWVVVEDDGGVVEYTEYWQHTGEKREVTSAIGYCGITLMPVLHQLLITGVEIASLLGFAAVVFRHRSAPELIIAAAACGVTGGVVAAAFGFYLLPTPLSLAYRLPDAVIGGGLALFAAGTLAAVRAGDDADGADSRIGRLTGGRVGTGLLIDAFAVALLQAPLLAAAVAFLL